MPSISLSPSTAVPSSSFVTYSSQAKQHQHQHEQQNQQESKHQLVPEENSINDLNEMELDALNNSSDSDSSHKKKQKFHINDGAKCKNKKDINPSVVPVNRIIEEECVRSSNDLNTSTMLDDDPCWGTPSQCSLKDLLKFIKKDTSIIYECSNYIVLNKPPDLRMDGPYLATVHKLLTYWYPSQSILQQIMTTDNEEQQNMNEQQLQDVKYPQHHLNNNYNDQLLFYISNLKNYSETIDNELRPCHQLDYATSGSLLIAKNQYAANSARICFENRSIHKQYIAIIIGHLSKSNNDTLRNLIIDSNTSSSNHNDSHDDVHITKKQLDNTMNQIENQYRKNRGKSNNSKKCQTFQGYLPKHSLFQQWQKQKQQLKQQQQKNNKVEEQSNIESIQQQRVIVIRNNNSNNPIDKNNLTKIADNQWDIVWKELNDYFGQVEYEINNNNLIASNNLATREQILSMDWKQIKKTHPIILKYFERASNIYNTLLKERNDLQTLNDERMRQNSTNITMDGLPTIFQVIDDDNQNHDDNDDSDYTTSSSSSNHQNQTSFYIAAPLGEPLDRTIFPMLIHSSYADKSLCPQLLFHPTTSTNSVHQNQIGNIMNNDNNNNSINNENSIEVNALDDAIRTDNKTSSSSLLGSDDGKNIDFKPALTKCTILGETYYDDTAALPENIMSQNRKRLPVTLVLLEPKTGRRHQLRVHTSLIGHPILGDQTYCIDNRNDASNVNNTIDDNISRLCLHSYSLTIPSILPENNDKKKKKKKNDAAMHNDEKISWRKVISTNPFTIDHEKETIQISMFT